MAARRRVAVILPAIRPGEGLRHRPPPCPVNRRVAHKTVLFGLPCSRVERRAADTPSLGLLRSDRDAHMRLLSCAVQLGSRAHRSRLEPTIPRPVRIDAQTGGLWLFR